MHFINKLSVSYTHLDVYKRQEDEVTKEVVDENQTNLDQPVEVRSSVHDTTGAVSYTHLDVYKRQVIRYM